GRAAGVEVAGTTAPPPPPPSVPAAPKAKSAARVRRAVGPCGFALPRNSLSNETPQKGQGVSLTRAWREEPGHGRRWTCAMGQLSPPADRGRDDHSSPGDRAWG